MPGVLLLLSLFTSIASGFLPPKHKSRFSVSHAHGEKIIVIGKIILDKYGNPYDRDLDETKVAIGGGGPQSAFGACAALAARDVLGWNDEDREQVLVRVTDATASPPKQNVIFVAPIGLKNWTPEMTTSLHSLLPMLKAPPTLVSSLDHVTPTIHIWHDENETVNWTPVNESFGEMGADSLWRINLIDDILDKIEKHDENVVLHIILQCGHNSTGSGFDALPLFNSPIMERVSAASIEPILFPNEYGIISHEDVSKTCDFFNEVIDYASDLSQATNRTKKLVLVSPDRPCYDALCSISESSQNATAVMKAIEFAIRDGSNGSIIVDNGSTTTTTTTLFPPATLKTNDSKPVNPTGAGNAYAGAYAACRGTGSSIEEAACIANAVGAVVCEHEHLPPWTWEVLERVVEGACEVRSKSKRSGQ